ncbi:MAG: hypothetical protein KDD35_00030 [Bdellovibrionales bacterium]|nr:hypothetical protein [Bdellovibrionales bacterium]
MSSGLDLSDWQVDSFSSSQIAYSGKPGNVGVMFVRLGYEWLDEKLTVKLNQDGLATSAELIFSGSDPKDNNTVLKGKVALTCRSEFQKIDF